MKHRRAIAAVVALLALASPATASASDGDFVGYFTQDTPHDGDTFWLCDDANCLKFRLCGIDAPERDTDAGYNAAGVLASLLLTGPVRCTQVGGGTPCDGRSKPTNGDRNVAQCFISGQDVARYMVETGNACDWRRFSGGAYAIPGGCQK